jgi:hypothetical protein
MNVCCFWKYEWLLFKKNEYIYILLLKVYEWILLLIHKNEYINMHTCAIREICKYALILFLTNEYSMCLYLFNKWSLVHIHVHIHNWWKVYVAVLSTKTCKEVSYTTTEKYLTKEEYNILSVMYRICIQWNSNLKVSSDTLINNLLRRVNHAQVPPARHALKASTPWKIYLPEK